MRSACAGSARRSASRRCRSTRMSATRTTCSAGSPTSSSARFRRSTEAGLDWKASLRATILGAREALLRHPWAPRVLEARAEPGPATLAYMDAVVGILRGGGFSIELTHHALHALGQPRARIRPGPVRRRQRVRPGGRGRVADGARAHAPAPRRDRAGTASHEGGLGGCDDDFEFGFALDLLLDGLDRMRAEPRSAG